LTGILAPGLFTQLSRASITAVNALNNGYPGDKADCGPDASGLLDTSAYTLDAASNTELNCLTIDGSPTSLQYPNLVKGQSLVVPLHTSAAMDDT
jgi:hypothetical protein